MIAITADPDAPTDIDRSADDWLAQEPALIRAAQATPAAFSALYEHYVTRIYRYCWRRVHDVQEAEDLTSAIFTRVLANLAHFRGGSFAAWLFQIAHNAVANHHRRDARLPLPLESAEQLTADLQTLDDLVTSDDARCVARLIAALPDDQRELLSLRIAGELSAKEIGVVLGKREGAVRVMLHRIIQQLRTGYETNCE